MSNYFRAWKRIEERRAAISSYKQVIKSIKEVSVVTGHPLSMDGLTLLIELRDLYTQIMIKNTELTILHLNTLKDCEQKNKLLWWYALRQTNELSQLCLVATEADQPIGDFIDHSLRHNQDEVLQKIMGLLNAPKQH